MAIGRNRTWELIQVDIAVPPTESQTGELEFERLVAAWDCEGRRYANGIARVYESIQGISYTDVLQRTERWTGMDCLAPESVYMWLLRHRVVT